jgi:ABC-type multidrug transport system fused ATPase/permease subunit
MTPRKREKPLEQQILPRSALLAYSIGSAVTVLVGALAVQWVVYDDWLHRSGLRISGSLLAAALTYLFTFRWLSLRRDRKREMLRRFETIARMNDRIRNALQAIELATYATNPESVLPVKSAVDSIETVLEEVLQDVRPASGEPKKRARAAAS